MFGIAPCTPLFAPVRENLRVTVTERGEKLFPHTEKLKLRRSSIPVVTHLDYEARVQIVRAEERPGVVTVLSRRLKRCSMSAVLVVTGTFLPVGAKHFHVYRMRLAMLLGQVNSIILPTLLFYLLFVPYNFISRF